jgi:hypothetical protein
MSVHVVISSTGHRRIHGAQRWLENRAAAEEVLIVGGTLDAARELARKVAKKKGAGFGWHRLTLPKLAFATAAPILAARGLTPLSRIGAGALVARLVHRINREGRLSASCETLPISIERDITARKIIGSGLPEKFPDYLFLVLVIAFAEVVVAQATSRVGEIVRWPKFIGEAVPYR